MKKRVKKRVALAFSMGVSHLEEIAYGIRQYCREHDLSWALVNNPEKHHLQISDLLPGQVDGVIAMLRTENDLELAKALSVPVINLSGALARSEFPRVCPDFYKMGEMAASYLLKKGFSHYAFYGVEGIHYSDLMCRGFEDGLSESEKSVFSFKDHAGSHFLGQVSEDLLKWLETLPKPVAVLAAHDPRAVMLMHACEELDIQVPEDLLLLGANNDRTVCDLAEPTLSSIQRDGIRNGYEAARLLAESFEGKCDDSTEIFLEATEVISRESSNRLLIQNPDLATAVKFIEDNISAQVNVDSVCHNLSRSRRWLEYAFRRELKQSPKEFIDDLRFKMAKDVLAGDEVHKLSTVAQLCGFNSVKQMNALFIKKTGRRASFNF